MTTSTASGLSAGGYTVTVTDANGCEAVKSITIEDPSGLELTVLDVTDETCAENNDGTATVSASGGTAPYSYLWSDGQTGIAATGLSAGTYTVTVTDAGGCEAVQTVVIGEPTPVLAEVIFSMDVSCYGAADGSATVNATGGTTPYTYVWSNGATTAMATGLAAGVTYTVTVTDASGCEATAGVTLAEPAELTALIESSTDVSCYGGADGTATVKPQGGTEPYTFMWSNGSTDKTVTGLGAGTYTAMVIDANGCIATTVVAIDEPSDAVTITFSNLQDADCAGSMDGQATAAASGGVAPYDFVWSTGQVNQNTTTSVATNLSAGSYTVTVTDANGCENIASITIGDPNGLMLTVMNVDHEACQGDNDGSATVSALGGTAPYTYLWSNGQTGPVANNLSAGTYTVTVTDANICEAVQTVVVDEPTPVIATIISSEDVSCHGDNDGTATVDVTGGIGGYTYAWSNGATTATATGLNAGLTYTVTVTDANGCETTAGITLDEPDELTAFIAGSTDVNCLNGADGTATVHAQGGTAPYIYAWNNGSADQTATSLSAGTYTVIVTDANGCMVTTSVTIDEPVTSVSVAISNVMNPDCQGNMDGTATATASGGIGGYAYLWSNGQTTATATNLTAGTYMVTATDANGCEAVATIVLTDPNGLVAIVTGTVDVSCNGDNDGAAAITAFGGSAPYTYQWPLSAGGQTGAIVSGLSAGQHLVTVTDAGGCQAVVLVDIDEPTDIIAEVILTTDETCYGSHDGTARVFATGGIPPYRYLWSNGQSSALATGLSGGILYTVTVTDDHNCTTTTSVTVGQSSMPLMASGVGIDAGCYGETDGSIQLTVVGGTAPYSYNWDNAPDVEDPNGLGAGNYYVTVTDSEGCTTSFGPVSVSQPTQVAVSIDNIIDASCAGDMSGRATVSASGGSGPYHFAWSTGQENSNAISSTAMNLSAGAYSVTVTDINGCEAVTGLTVGDPNGLSAFVSGLNNVTCYGGDDGWIAVAVNGGTAPYSYDWDATNGFQSVGQDINGLEAGVYSVTISDANGCEFTIGAINLIQPDQLLPEIIDVVHESCLGNNDGSALVNVAGGTAPYTYDWSNDGPETIDNDEAQVYNLAPGVYQVTVTDASDCESVTSVTINPGVPLDISLIADIGPLCPGDDVPSILLSALPVNPSIVYAWTVSGGDIGLINGASSGLNANIPSFTVTGTGTAVVTVSASLGTIPGQCVATETFTITVEDTGAPSFVDCPSAITVGTDDSRCTALVNFNAPVATDDCGGVTVTQTAGPASGLMFPLGVTTVEFTATDGAGLSTTCSFTVTVQDTELPTPVCQDITVQLDASGSVAILPEDVDGGSYDNCQVSNLVFENGPFVIGQLSFDCNALGDNNVILRVVDGAGNRASCVATVTVEDNEPPVVESCPANITVDNDVDECGAVVHYDAPAFSDNCGGSGQPGILVHGLASGASFPVGTTDVEYQYTDAGGSSVNCSFTVTVEDNDFPEITCPDNIVVGADGSMLSGTATIISTGPCGVTISYAPPVGTDNCPGAVTSLSSGLGSNPNYYQHGGTYTETYTVTDTEGNSASCSFTIMVEDPIVPMITCPQDDITVYTAQNECSVIVTYASPFGSDNCPGYTLSLTQGLNSGAAFPLGTTTVEFTITDNSGNTNTCSFDVNVIDDDVPVVTTCAPNQNVPTSSNGLGDCSGVVPDLTGQVDAADNCTIASITQFPAAGTAFGSAHGGQQLVTLFITDLDGNTVSCQSILTLVDDEAPVITDCPDNRSVISSLDGEGDCSALIPDLTTQVTATDNCSADA
ncbi:MAG: HYR domain-containing protein, partial [Candidatus Competibacteraceae bacterium]|nr:HYR domain-containing protein [Candidatus Competibacteraceae bacterium]